ncbi:MAG: MotA/TolQ/ExbB proton channel family protein [Bacteroidales bacterium]|nr:MotA/TolQ/ExbB proton channel family protein [Bacteroidales bacterium]
MFQIIMKGGWILIPIFFLSLVSFWVIFERWTILKRASRTQNLVSTINPMLKEGKLEMAINTCETTNQPVGKVLAAGLHTMGFTIRDIQDAMEAEAHQQIDSLSRGINYLGIIATIAPMFGFLGTIFGVIKIFYNISLTDNISIGIISGGLYQKMVSSASGLLVGIIAFAGYHLLNSQIDRITSMMEKQSNELMALLRSRG